MKTEIKHPDKLVSTGAYSAGIVMDGWLFVSGHAGEDLRTGEPVPGGIAEQTRAALGHIGRVLTCAGAGFADVAKSSCHLAHIEDFDQFNAVYAEYSRSHCRLAQPCNPDCPKACSWKST